MTASGQTIVLKNASRAPLLLQRPVGGDADHAVGKTHNGSGAGVLLRRQVPLMPNGPPMAYADPEPT
jgi:hypothetical protein